MTYESIKAYDGTDLRVARFEPEGELTGVIQIVHGFGEGLAHYIDIAKYFVKNGYACVIHDQRGFGEMPGLTESKRQKARGVVPGYYYLLEDINEIHNKINIWYPSQRKILFGHSMGANIVANYLIRYDGYEKAILEAPWFRLYKPLPMLVHSIAKLTGRLSGQITVSAKIAIDDITRNKEIADGLKTDGIYHNRMSLRLYTQVVDAGEFAIKNANMLSIPTLLLCPGGDKIVCPKAIREFAEGASDNVVLVEYPDAYHCLHADIINVEVLTAMLEFCNSRA